MEPRDRKPATDTFYGTTLKIRNEPHFRLSERSYPPTWTTPPHVHGRPLFCLTLEGSYHEILGSKMRHCTPATAVLHAPGEEHAERFETAGGRSLVVEIASDWLDRIREHSVVCFDSSTVFRGALPVLGARLYKEFQGEDAASSLVIEGLMLELAGELCRAGGPKDHRPPRWLEEARDLVGQHYTRNLSLAAVADAVGVHPVHLAQTFRKFYRCTVGDYVRGLRIEFACHQLASSETPLCEIALLAGFADQSHFTRTFRRIVGVPPSEYREIARPRRRHSAIL